MKFDIKYRNTVTGETYGLKVDADNYNEAARIAKDYRGPSEEITEIKADYGSIFSDILRDMENSFPFLGRAGK